MVAIEARSHKFQKSITSSTMSSLTDEQTVELIDQWYQFGPINEEEEKVMCHFATIFNGWVADCSSTVLKAQWRAKMRPENGYKVLLNDST